METLIAELFAFAVAVFVIVRYVVPPARTAMARQQQVVAKQVEDAERARAELASAQTRYDEAMAAAHTDAAQIRDRARAEAGYIADEVAASSDQDVVRIHQRGDDQLVTARQQAVRELRRDTGQLAIRLAGRIVTGALADEARRAGTIDRFLDKLEDMSRQDQRITTVSGPSLLQGVSRDSMASARDDLDARLRDTEAASATDLGDELFAVAYLLAGQRPLLRSLADPSIPEDARTRLVHTLFGQRLSEPALGTLSGLVASRWSKPVDLLDVVETIAREAYFAAAEREGALDTLEDELFRFGRIVDGQPRLATLLGDTTAEPDRRLALLESLLAGKVSEPTLRVLRQTVRSPRRRSLESTLEELTDLVAVRRGRSVASVTAPLALTDSQQERLRTLLSQVYGRDVSLQIAIEEAMLGGLIVELGDDLIDGSVAAQLNRAAQGLPT